VSIFDVDAQNLEQPELARTWFVDQAMRPNPVALVVSADRQVRQLIVASLDEMGCATLDASTDTQGLEFASVTRVDCVIVDACSPETPVSHMIRQLRLRQPEIRVLYLIDRANVAPSPWSALRRTDSCLNKPFELGELCKIVESWLDDRLSFVNVARMSLN
jgi:DNA-binding response OmpR family regulator